MTDECFHNEWNDHTEEIAVFGTDKSIASLMTPFALCASLVSVVTCGKCTHATRMKAVLETVLAQRVKVTSH